jgi:NADH dehydrogenase FAD-containing subunit
MPNETSDLRSRPGDPPSSTRARIVIVGAGYAGLSCALRLARKSGGRAQITLINGSESFVERIRLHERATGAPGPCLTLPDMVRDAGVQLRIGWVESIDLQQRTVAFGGEAIAWDRLVLALGAQVDVDAVPGVRELAYELDESSTFALAARLSTLVAEGARVAVVGGGLTGVEAASELAEAYPGLSIVLVTRGDIVPGLSHKARQRVRDALTRRGVELREHVSVRALRHDMLITEQGPIVCAACVWTTGFVASPLARSAGLATNDRGQVWVDAQLRSVSHPAVYAAGDLAVHREPQGVPVPMGCKSAFPTGLYVAENLSAMLTGDTERTFRYTAVPFCISLGRTDGVIELPATHTKPMVLHGMLAARIKELICRGTVWALALERRRAAWAHWYRSRTTPRLQAHVDAGSAGRDISERAGV